MNYFDQFDLLPHETLSAKAGDVFGRYTVLCTGKKQSAPYRYVAVCQCSCGAPLRSVSIAVLTSGQSTSCGCYHRQAVTKHGLWRDPLFKRWKSMIDRCQNPKNKSYKNYGARGIKVCERWMNMDNFFADMRPGMADGLSVERKDNNGDYSPENCRWATAAEQKRNQRVNRNITIGDKTMCLADWCLHYGMRYQLVWERISKQGWEPIRALTTPVIRINK